MEVDVNKPLENPVLKELFARVRQARTDEERAEAFNEAAEEIVMNAHFLSAVEFSQSPEDQGDGTAVCKAETTMSLAGLTTQDGRSFLPVFIDWEELGKWDAVRGETPSTMIFSFDDYAAMVLGSDGGSGLVVNPFSDNMVITREMVAQWREHKQIVLTGHAEHTVKKDTQVLLGEPKEYPTVLVEALSDCAKREKSIQRLWLRLMQKDGEFSYLVIVENQGGGKPPYDQLAERARPYLNGMYVDMVPYGDGFGRDAAEGVEPFYKRQKGLFGSLFG